MIDDLEDYDGEYEEILMTEDAQVLACRRGKTTENMSRLEIHSTRELPYTRFMAREVDDLIKALTKMRHDDMLERVKLTTVDML